MVISLHTPHFDSRNFSFKDKSTSSYKNKVLEDNIVRQEESKDKVISFR